MKSAVIAGIDTADARPPGLPELWSARYEARLTPARSGRYRFSISGGGEIALFVDGHRVVTMPKQNFRSVAQGTVDLVGGRQIAVRLDYARASTISPAELRLGWEAPDAALIEEAVAAARASDTAMVFVSDVVSEGADRTNLRLPGDQDALIEAVAAANARTVVVLHTAGPVLMPWKDRVGGIIVGWYAGEQAAPALASMIFGDISPSGRLPVTFPASERDGPSASTATYPGVGLTVRYDEGLAVGYRWYQRHRRHPLYPFGFGLAYTDFAYGPGDMTKIAGGWRISTTIRNVGDRAGIAVPQLYVAFPAATGEPPLQLRDFARVWLEPGTARTVSFTLAASDLLVWMEADHHWRHATGRFQAFIGSSSTNLSKPCVFDIGS